MNGELFPLEFNLASEVQSAPAAPKVRPSSESLFPVDEIRSTAPTALDQWNDEHEARLAALEDEQIADDIKHHRR